MNNSSDNSITGNEISENGFGIFLGISSNNKIYYNNFINNKMQVKLANSINIWDDGSKGNYWSDYKGRDLNNDGIGDVPYIIDENNKDNYPLITKIVEETEVFINILYVIIIVLIFLLFLSLIKEKTEDILLFKGEVKLGKKY